MKRPAFALAVALGLLAAPSSAADHYDMFESKNPIAGQEERHHDIADLFVFPSPNGSGKLVMVMNTHNRAHADSVFSNVIHYSFRVRSGKVREQGAEYRFTCTFDVPEAGAAQKARCATYKIENGKATPVRNGTTAVTLGQKDGGANPLVRAFAGIRSDAFFGDAVGLLAMVKTHALTYTAGQILPEHLRNLTYNTNDLSIVLEVDVKALLGESQPYFRVAAETATKKGQ